MFLVLLKKNNLTDPSTFCLMFHLIYFYASFCLTLESKIPIWERRWHLLKCNKFPIFYFLEYIEQCKSLHYIWDSISKLVAVLVRNPYDLQLKYPFLKSPKDEGKFSFNCWIITNSFNIEPSLYDKYWKEKLVTRGSHLAVYKSNRFYYSLNGPLYVGSELLDFVDR